MNITDAESIQNALNEQGIIAEVSLTVSGEKLHIDVIKVDGNSHYWLGGFLKALVAINYPFETNVPLPY